MTQGTRGSAATEIELKLQYRPDAFDALRAHPLFAADATDKRIVSVYFDTPDRRVRTAGLSLRVRHLGERRVQTIKANAGGEGLFERSEWVVALAADAPGAASCRGTPLEGCGIDWAAVAPVFVVDVERAVRLHATPDGEVELALDRGVVRAGARHAGVAEVELELKSGDRPALFALARRLAAVAAMWPSTMSKADAGYRLADGDAWMPSAGDGAAAVLRRHDDAAGALADPAFATLVAAAGLDPPASAIEAGLAAIGLVERSSG